MHNQRLMYEVREIVETLLDDRGFEAARDWVEKAIKSDTSKNAFWSRVWDELHREVKGERK